MSAAFAFEGRDLVVETQGPSLDDPEHLWYDVLDTNQKKLCSFHYSESMKDLFVLTSTSDTAIAFFGEDIMSRDPVGTDSHKFLWRLVGAVYTEYKGKEV